MPSRRDQIQLTESEQAELLASERVAIVTSNGAKGWPHSMPMWFTVRDGVIWVWTYAKSQKVRNLERDPKATILVETGTEYTELRGIMVESEAVIHRDPAVVAEFGKDPHGPLQRGHRFGRGRRRSGARGPSGEARRDQLPAGAHAQLGPPQARRNLLSELASSLAP